MHAGHPAGFPSGNGAELGGREGKLNVTALRADARILGATTSTPTTPQPFWADYVRDMAAEKCRQPP